MNRTATEHANIAAESVNCINKSLLAAQTGDSDVRQIKDAYEVTAALKLLSQRLTLTATQLDQRVSGWDEEGHLLTGHAFDTSATVMAFSTAMTQAHDTARALFNALDDATNALALIGWQKTPGTAPVLAEQ